MLNPTGRQVEENVAAARSIGYTEWVAVMHGQHGTTKVAYRSPLLLAEGLAAHTKEGWSVATVYERVRKTYGVESFPELATHEKNNCRTLTGRVNDGLCHSCRVREEVCT